MKGAIFDMDGTLLDSMQVWVHVGEQYLRNRGIEPEEGLGDVLFPMSMRDGAVYVKERYGLPDPPDTIVTDMDAIVFAAYRDEVRRSRRCGISGIAQKAGNTDGGRHRDRTGRWWRRRSRGPGLARLF